MVNKVYENKIKPIKTFFVSPVIDSQDIEHREKPIKSIRKIKKELGKDQRKVLITTEYIEGGRHVKAILDALKKKKLKLM